MSFEIVGDITQVGTIAVGTKIRELSRLRSLYGSGRWRKMKSVEMIRLRRAEYAEQSGTGMKRTVSGEGRSSGSDMSRDQLGARDDRNH